MAWKVAGSDELVSLIQSDIQQMIRLFGENIF